MLLLDVTNLVLTVHWQRSSFRGRKKNTHRQILRVHILKLYLFLLPHINFHNLSLLPKSHANKLSGCRLPCSGHINGSLCGRTSSFCMFCPSSGFDLRAQNICHPGLGIYRNRFATSQWQYCTATVPSVMELLWPQAFMRVCSAYVWFLGSMSCLGGDSGDAI